MKPKQKPQGNTLTEFFEEIIESLPKLFMAVIVILITILRKQNFKAFKFLESDLFKPLLGKLHTSKRITVSDIKSHLQDTKKLDEMIKLSNKIPLGTDLRSYEVIFLDRKEMNQHVLVAGATGEGKTTLMTTQIRHAIIHNLPIIIIDPKGDINDVEKIRSMAELHGRGDKFKLFSLVYPEKSCSYNPLKVGTPEQLKSKIIEALGLTHEYYGSIAAQFLANLLDILVYLKVKDGLNLATLLKYLSSPNDLGKLDEILKSRPRETNLHIMMSKMHSLKSTDRKDLSGIIAHINAMCLTEFNELLGNIENPRGEIDFSTGLNKAEIMYFQMNLPGYADFGSRIGKLIIQDLKLTASLIHAGTIIKKYDFGACFIDEFGSFVTTSFVELQKMIRSTNIGLNLYFQGIADLETISKPLAHQILGNTKVKIILRQDIDTDVETWSSMAGTEDAEIESYQMNHDSLLKSRTGMGNMHEGKKMKIDFDVFKNLNVGQAIVINKGRHTQNIIQIWQQDFTSLKNVGSKNLTKPSLFLPRVKLLDQELS